jgi:hypothetical protein
VEGFGAQFNVNIFTPAGQPQPLTAAQRDTLRATIQNLKPGHSRVFLSRELVDRAQPRPADLKALLDTLELAQHAGANVNLTFWGQGTYAGIEKLRALRWPQPGLRAWPHELEQQGKLKWPGALTSGQLTQPAELMRRFARIIERTRKEGLTCVTHATIQNEVNGDHTDIAMKRSPGLSMRLYEWLYRLFDKELKAIPDPVDGTRTLRDVVRVIGGDLVLDGNSPQDEWLAYMRANMDVARPQFPSVIDGYSIHVYWEPGNGGLGFPQRLEERLGRLPATLGRLGIDKPVYVTEYGVRKLGQKPEPGGVGSGEAIEFSPEVAFQHAWFNALAPQQGCVGFAKWVLYRTDESADFGEWGMIDAANPAHGRPPFGRSPAYRMTRFFNHLADPDWKAAGLGRDATGTILASKFAGGGNESIAILNRGEAPQDVRVSGLKKGTQYFRAVWNGDTKGGLSPLDPFTTSDAGAQTVTVPGHGVVGLSTRRMPL